MSDNNSTNFPRLAVGDVRDNATRVTANQFGDVHFSARFRIDQNATVANAKNAIAIRGTFDVVDAYFTGNASAVYASAKTINLGTDATAARFAAFTVPTTASERRTMVPASGATVPDWIANGTAAAVTTVRAYVTDVSGIALTSPSWVTVTFARRNTGW